MSKQLISATMVVLYLLVFSTCSYALFASGKITIKVVGEDAVPIDGARVGIGFDDNRSSSKENSVIGLTNKEGFFTGSATTTSGYLAFNVTKNGYYKTTGDYQYKEKKAFGWKPWNPELKIVLRKIEDPVPMYVRDTRNTLIEIPVIGKDVGFDLIEFDWVTPFGIGKQPDLIFHLERLPVVSRKNYEATLTISFANKNDGIQPYNENLQYGSQFKLPRYAPETGYQQKLVLYESFGANRPTKYNFNFRENDLNYIFRVRSQEKDGKIEQAMYGKILKYVSFSAIRSKTAEIYLMYYLNPDGTLNLEFDPKRNLFDNLSDGERVMMP